MNQQELDKLMKPFKEGLIKDLLRQVEKGEISFGKMVEILNIKANEFYCPPSQRSKPVYEVISASTIDEFNKKLNQYMDGNYIITGELQKVSFPTGEVLYSILLYKIVIFEPITITEN